MGNMNGDSQQADRATLQVAKIVSAFVRVYVHGNERVKREAAAGLAELGIVLDMGDPAMGGDPTAAKPEGVMRADEVARSPIYGQSDSEIELVQRVKALTGDLATAHGELAIERLRVSEWKAAYDDVKKKRGEVQGMLGHMRTLHQNQYDRIVQVRERIRSMKNRLAGWANRLDWNRDDDTRDGLALTNIIMDLDKLANE